MPEVAELDSYALRTRSQPPMRSACPVSLSKVHCGAVECAVAALEALVEQLRLVGEGMQLARRRSRPAAVCRARPWYRARRSRGSSTAGRRTHRGAGASFRSRRSHWPGAKPLLLCSVRLRLPGLAPSADDARDARRGWSTHEAAALAARADGGTLQVDEGAARHGDSAVKTVDMLRVRHLTRGGRWRARRARPPRRRRPSPSAP